MALEDNTERSGKRNNQLIKISLTASLTVCLFIIEIYEIMNDPHNLAVIGVLGVFILAAVIAETMFIDGMVKDRSIEQKKIYHDIYRSEKASYLLMKKYFDQIDRKIDQFVKQMEIPYKELFAAQKALAKIQINKNKANADALLISNEKMLHKISRFQKELVNASVSDTDEKENDLMDHTISQLLERQQEIAQAIKEMEQSLRTEISKTSEKMNTEFMSRMNSGMEFRMDPIETETFDVSGQEPQKVDQTIQMPAAEESELLPLDIGEDFNGSEEEKSQTPLSSSTESELDKLLLGMDHNSSGSTVHQEEDLNLEEPELGPILGEPELEAIVEKTTAEPELGPIVEETTAEPELGPIVEETTAEPELGPIVEKTTAEPELGPIVEETTAEPELMPELAPMQTEPKLETVQAEPDSVKSTVSLKEEMPAFNSSDSSLVMTSDKTVSLSEDEEKEEAKQKAIESEPGDLKPEMINSETKNLKPKAIESELEGLKPDLVQSETEKSVTAPEIRKIEEVKQESVKVPDEIVNGNAETEVKEPDLETKEPDLEQIMKEMNIEHILDEPLEDIDIDKILEKPPADLRKPSADPDQVMNSDEIAALIANTDLLFQSDSDDNKSQSPDLSDPGYIMNSDEIAALIANM